MDDTFFAKIEQVIVNQSKAIDEHYFNYTQVMSYPDKYKAVMTFYEMEAAGENILHCMELHQKSLNAFHDIIQSISNQTDNQFNIYPLLALYNERVWINNHRISVMNVILKEILQKL